MSDVKWVKITIDMFDNRKIKHLRKLPDGDSIVLIWIMLLTMAGRCNAGGMIFLTENIPYTTKMLADELDFSENTVVLALRSLEELNMISTNSGLLILNWEEYQNAEALSKIREQTRKRVKDYKARQKLAAPVTQGNAPGNASESVTDALPVTQGNATEEDIDIDKDLDREVEGRSKRKKKPSTYPEDSKQIRCSTFLAERIQMRLPSEKPFPPERLQQWADAFDKCHRIDGHPWDEIGSVLKFSQEDPFWQQNILSGKTFREKYLQLLAKMNASGSGRKSRAQENMEASYNMMAQWAAEGDDVSEQG